MCGQLDATGLLFLIMYNQMEGGGGRDSILDGDKDQNTPTKQTTAQEHLELRKIKDFHHSFVCVVPLVRR